MKRMVLSALVLAVFTLSGCGGGNRNTATQTNQMSANVKIDFGELKGNTYTNKFFKFKITKPASWIAQDDEARIGLMKQGVRTLAAGSQQLASTLEASEVNVLNMFMFSKFEIGTPGKTNPSILGVAENLKLTPGIKKGKDYLWHAKELLKKSNMQATFGKEYTRKLGQVTFDVLELELATVEKVNQKYFATVIDGYAFTIISSHVTDEELKEVEAILEKIEMD